MKFIILIIAVLLYAYSAWDSTLSKYFIGLAGFILANIAGEMK